MDGFQRMIPAITESMANMFKFLFGILRPFYNIASNLELFWRLNSSLVYCDKFVGLLDVGQTKFKFLFGILRHSSNFRQLLALLRFKFLFGILRPFMSSDQFLKKTIV